jgi:lipopolysaccharide export system protein LptC
MSIATDSTLEQRRIARNHAFRKAARHSVGVRLLRKVIPLSAVLLSAGLAGGMILARTEVSTSVEAAAPKGLQDGRITMESPHLTGFQKDSRSYEVSAITASQDVKAPDSVDLSSPLARIETAIQSFTDIAASRGTYNSVKEILDLDEKIKIVTDTGYTLRLDRARVDLKNGKLDSSRPVIVEMQTGRIEARSMRATDNGGEVVFSGGVTSTFTDLFADAGSVDLEAVETKKIDKSARPSP